MTSSRPPLLPRWAFFLMLGMWAGVSVAGAGAVGTYLSLTDPDQRPTWQQGARYFISRGGIF